jgi:tetratricopeptide (TPR) repeat protein/TolB-like protein
MPRWTLVIAALAALWPTTAAAQCPDGSPPPCRSTVVAAAPPRRSNPPIDPRSWVVVPFDNVTRNSEIEWLRAGSVNLLYLGMSRWNDVRVVDDERVADLMRDLPPADASTLALSTGMTIAKRAGAGRLVMGEVIRIGSRTAVTAKVYDVTTGQRVRSVTEETAVADSVMPMFGRLAQKVLNVAPPAGANVGSIGTSSIAAYQEYLRGVQALNAFRITDARRAFRRALELDSTFALAHYKMTVVSGWDGGTGSREHIEAAARLSAALPERERQLINGHLWHQRGQLGRACEVFSSVLRADSADVDAWYGLGDCTYHDVVVEPVAGDSTRLRFRGDFNASVRAFRRALELDPAFHLAYQHLVDAYQSHIRFGQHCVGQTCAGYAAFAVNRGDSLVMVPMRDTARLREQFADYVRSGSRRRNIAVSRRIAEEWLASSPNEDRARVALASTYYAAGELESAGRVLANVGTNSGTHMDWLVGLLRIEVAARLWRGSDAVRLYDSLRAVPGVPGLLAQIGPVFGRLAEYDSLSATLGTTTAARAIRRPFIPRMMLGLMSDSMTSIDQAVFDEGLAAGSSVAASNGVASSLAFGFRFPRARWPAVDPAVARPLLAPGLAVARGDLTSLPAIARQLDSISSIHVSALVADTGLALVAADAYLMSGDTASALRMLRRMLDTAVTYTALSNRDVVGQSYAVIVPRAMLMRGELAAALGHRDEAARWFDRLIALWRRPDPDLGPLIERARRGRAALNTGD